MAAVESGIDSGGLTWGEFVAAWARAHDGYDLTHAPQWRKRVMRGVHRFAVLGARFGMTPAASMVVSVACSSAVPLLASQGGPWPVLAACALVLGLGADQLTGALWVLAGGITRLGGFYQSLLDRFAEVCWLLAMALLGAHLVMVVACAGLVWAHEYVRARANLGRTAAGTLGDRATRAWLVLAGLLLAAVSAQLSQDLAAGVVTMAVFIWAAFALIGVFQLVAIIRKVLT